MEIQADVQQNSSEQKNNTLCYTQAFNNHWQAFIQHSGSHFMPENSIYQQWTVNSLMCNTDLWLKDRFWKYLTKDWSHQVAVLLNWNILLSSDIFPQTASHTICG